jgi:hypothetical protein
MFFVFCPSRVEYAVAAVTAAYITGVAKDAVTRALRDSLVVEPSAMRCLVEYRVRSARVPSLSPTTLHTLARLSGGFWRPVSASKNSVPGVRVRVRIRTAFAVAIAIFEPA